jgi:hypothetical protein
MSINLRRLNLTHVAIDRKRRSPWLTVCPGSASGHLLAHPPGKLPSSLGRPAAGSGATCRRARPRAAGTAGGRAPAGPRPETESGRLSLGLPGETIASHRRAPLLDGYLKGREVAVRVELSVLVFGPEQEVVAQNPKTRTAIS